MSVIHLDKKNFEEIVSSKTPVVIDFWAPWCGPCQMMGPVFEELAEEFKGKLQFAKVNVDEEIELASKFEVQGIPTLIVLKNKKEVERIVGFNPKATLKAKIDSILK
jgi:thioredoxin 1